MIKKKKVIELIYQANRNLEESRMENLLMADEMMCVISIFVLGFSCVFVQDGCCTGR